MDRVRVLIAEDEEAVREGLAELISSDSSLELVGKAKDAEEAIDIAGQECPDVAVLDVRMPGGGGPRAAREIKRRSPNTSMVAFSIYEDRNSILGMLKAGAVGYVAKSASNTEIKEAILRSVRGEASLAASVTTDLVHELAQQLDRPTEGSESRRREAERIRRVLDRDAIKMAFQPIVDLRGGHVVGVEALARFACPPKRGPDLWFAEAEAVGLLRDVELAAIRVALHHLDEIPFDCYLSVNVSPETASAPVFWEALDDVPAGRIVIELTEHAPVQDYQALREALREHRARGMRVAIDDAGAGFASLRHILRLTPDFIKLDITLTREIDTDLTRQALVSALISFGSRIGATIVAEGVETEAQLDALRRLGVRYAQGFYLAPPGPISRSGARWGLRSPGRGALDDRPLPVGVHGQAKTARP